jgi:hypothetical protein
MKAYSNITPKQNNKGIHTRFPVTYFVSGILRIFGWLLFAVGVYMFVTTAAETKDAIGVIIIHKMSDQQERGTDRK